MSRELFPVFSLGKEAVAVAALTLSRPLLRTTFDETGSLKSTDTILPMLAPSLASSTSDSMKISGGVTVLRLALVCSSDTFSVTGVCDGDKMAVLILLLKHWLFVEQSSAS